jgi:hypothetical protein
MSYEVKRIGVWSVAKISFVLGAVFGLLAGIFVWMLSAVLVQIPFEEFGGDMEGLGLIGAMGIMLPFMMAIFYGVAGMITNAILAAMYNLMAGLVGGLEVTLGAAQGSVTTAPPAPPRPEAPHTFPPTSPPSG